MTGTKPNILFIGNVDPKSKATGSQRRFLATARGLAAAGDVDYLQWGSRPWRRRAPAVRIVESPAIFGQHVFLRRYAFPDRFSGILEFAWTLRASSGWPRRVRPYSVVRSAPPRRSSIEAALPNLRTYDLVWCFELPSAFAVLPMIGEGFPPVVVDAEAVHNVVPGAAARRETEAGTWLSDLRTRGAELFERRDGDASRYWLPRVARHAVEVTFTSPLELAVFDVQNSVVLPNGCDVVPFHGARRVSRHPVLTFIGWMGYPPNADAARFLVQEIVPALRQVMDQDFEVRVVGSAPPEVQQLAQDPNVVVTGYVDDLRQEFERADVIAVPVRNGAGTRVKVLEAFANQVPVVSTSFGPLGLDAMDGEHLLIADTPEEFAVACRRLWEDEALRSQLVSNAYELVSTRHDWSRIETQISQLALRAIKTAGTDEAPSTWAGA